MANTGRPPSCTCDKCHKCKKATYMRNWYRHKTPEQRRLWINKRTTKDKRSRSARQPLVSRANTITSNAIRDGKLIRQLCHCGAPKVDAHHPDYEKPLEVIWLCRPHHHELHGFSV